VALTDKAETVVSPGRHGSGRNVFAAALDPAGDVVRETVAAAGRAATDSTHPASLPEGRPDTGSVRLRGRAKAFEGQHMSRVASPRSIWRPLGCPRFSLPQLPEDARPKNNAAVRW